MVTTRSLSKAASPASKCDIILVENYSNRANDLPGCIHNKLPLEVLCLIFLYTLPQGTIEIPTTLRLFRSPWTLEQVCRAWRNIVPATPALWTNLTVYLFPNFKFEEFEEFEHELQICLSRSAEAPLAISIAYKRLYGMDVFSNCNVTQKFDKLLFASSYRWTELSCAPEYVLFHLHPARAPLPALRHLHLQRGVTYYTAHHVVAPANVTLTAANLTHLTLPTDFLDALSPDFPFAQLTYLELSSVVNDTLLDKLALMPNLVELDMRYASIQTDLITWDKPTWNKHNWGKPRPKPIELNHLSVLSINYNDLFDARCLLDELIAPNVHLLNLHIPFQGIHSTALDGFVISPQPYSSSIKRLTVDRILTNLGAKAACQMVVNILHVMPGIAYIDFLHPEDPVDKMMTLLDRLENARRHDASLVPDLKRVTVGNGRVKKLFEVSA